MSSTYCVLDVAEHRGLRREQADKVAAGMELTLHCGRPRVGRVSERRTAGKRGRAEVGAAGEACWGCVTRAISREDLQEVQKVRQGQGTWHPGEMEEQRGSHRGWHAGHEGVSRGAWESGGLDGTEPHGKGRFGILFK